MSDQYPQYQPPEGQSGRPGEPEETRRFDAPPPPGAQPQPGSQPQPGAWTQDPGYQYQEQQTGQNPYTAPYSGAATPPPPPPAGQGPEMSAKGFFAALFDFNFDTFITPKIIKAVYIVVTVLVGLFAVGGLLTALVSGRIGTIIMALIAVPLLATVYLALARMTLELYFAVVRLSEDVHDRLPKQ